jgi:nitroimidazol reductase NimA-like FMN-containing flavoprotein (pyridoxamine 5'-phosphate oxidase superfamily)
MPAYGIEPSEVGLLDWSWAEQRLRTSRNYWLATSRADARPHLMALWALWADGELFFSTDGVKAANLRRDPRCSIATESGSEAVVLEGSVRTVARGDAWDAVRDRYAEKYGEGFPEGSPLFALTPEVAFGFIEAASLFANAATRWTFEGR